MEIQTNTQKTILIIEDETPLNEAIKLRLEKRGYRALQAFSAEEGIEILKKEKPDFIWLDFLLPGMNGLEFLEYIRKNPDHRDDKVAIVSVSADFQKRETAEALGIVDYIVKADHRLDDIVTRILEKMK